MYIEPFFGAGGMFFSKELANTNIVNDLDGDVVNFYEILQADRELFESEIMKLPLSSELLAKWRANPPLDKMTRALSMFLQSNCTFMGKGETLRIGTEKDKKQLYKYIDRYFKKLEHTFISNKDFSNFLDSIRYHEHTTPFIYCDPPYLGTANNYSNGFTEEQFENLILKCIEKQNKHGAKFAISEFNNPIVLNYAKKYGLFVYEICERKSLRNRNIEILMTNYETKVQLF